MSMWKGVILYLMIICIVCLQLELPMGRYVVIPSTDKPGMPGNFLLRVYTSANAHAMYVLCHTIIKYNKINQ